MNKQANKKTQKKNAQLQIEEVKRKQKAILKSETHINCLINAAFTIDSIHNDKLDISTIGKALIESSSQVISGNIKEIEMMLMTQAQTLNILFHRTLTQITSVDMINQIQVFSDIALRAQNQSRKTLAVLAELKHPRRTTFIKQQNNAVNQLVNNRNKSNNSLNSEKPANELLSEVAHETLDIRRTPEAISVNPTMEALEPVNRS